MAEKLTYLQKHSIADMYAAALLNAVKESDFGDQITAEDAVDIVEMMHERGQRLWPRLLQPQRLADIIKAAVKFS